MSDKDNDDKLKPNKGAEDIFSDEQLINAGLTLASLNDAIKNFAEKLGAEPVKGFENKALLEDTQKVLNKLPITSANAYKGQEFLNIVRTLSKTLEEITGEDSEELLKKNQIKIEALIEALIDQQNTDIENNLLLLWLKKFRTILSNYRKLKYKLENPPFYLKLIEEIMSLLSHILAITGRKLDKILQIYLLNDVLARFAILMQDVNGVDPKGYGNPIKLIFTMVSKSLNALIDKAQGMENNIVAGSKVSVPPLQELKPPSKETINMAAKGIIKENAQLTNGIEIKIGQSSKVAGNLMNPNQGTLGQPVHKSNKVATNNKENKVEAKDEQGTTVKYDSKVNVSQKLQTEKAKVEIQVQENPENKQNNDSGQNKRIASQKRAEARSNRLDSFDISKAEDAPPKIKGGITGEGTPSTPRSSSSNKPSSNLSNDL